MNSSAAFAAPPRSLRIAGLVLITVAVLELPAMGHHPSVKMQDAAQAIAALRAAGALSAWVHGILIALMVAGFSALLEYSLWRGLARASMRIAVTTYAIGGLAMILAACISGFVTPGFAQRAPTDPAQLSAAVQILQLCGVLNRAMAGVGTMAMCAAILIWSADLLRGIEVPWPHLMTGILGILVGVLVPATLLAGLIRLDVPGMMLIVVLQSLWSTGIGLILVSAAFGGRPPERV